MDVPRLMTTPSLLIFPDRELFELRLLFTVPLSREEDLFRLTVPLLLLELEDRFLFTVPLFLFELLPLFTVPEELLDRFEDEPRFTVPRLLEPLPDLLRTVEDEREGESVDLFIVPRLLVTWLDRASDRTVLRSAVFRTLASSRVLRIVLEPREIKPVFLGP